MTVLETLRLMTLEQATVTLTVWDVKELLDYIDKLEAVQTITRASIDQFQQHHDPIKAQREFLNGPDRT